MDLLTCGLMLCTDGFQENTYALIILLSTFPVMVALYEEVIRRLAIKLNLTANAAFFQHTTW